MAYTGLASRTHGSEWWETWYARYGTPTCVKDDDIMIDNERGVVSDDRKEWIAHGALRERRQANVEQVWGSYRPMTISRCYTF